MLQSLGSQRVGHYLVTEQEQGKNKKALPTSLAEKLQLQDCKLTQRTIKTSSFFSSGVI